MKNIPFLNLKLANEPIEEELKQAACEVISSGRYLHGEHTQLLEQEIATLCKTSHCVAVSNGLDALRLILRAYIEMGRLCHGDAVIVPANTFVASILAISDNGLKPIICEPDLHTMNLDISAAAQLVKAHHARAIMPVHLYGTPCWDTALNEIAQEHDLLVIEDNAQAIGAQAATAGLNGTRTTGGLGNAAGISFYPTKNLGALGDAGAVTTSDSQLAATVRALANYGSDRRYHNIMQGLNCRIDELQAAMLRVKLRHLNEEITRRNAIVKVYNTAINHRQVTTPAIFAGTTQVWHQYVVRVSRRQEFIDYMKENGIGTDIHYATPAHLQPCYPTLATHPMPVTELLANEVVSLPIAHPITTDDASYIAGIINSFPA